MLERLVNDDQAKAEELFHEYVVAKSREIYENLIEAEIADDEEEDKDPEDSDVKEESEVDEDGDLDEEFEDIAYEGDDETGGPAGDMGDDLEGEMGPEEEGEDLSAESEEELFQDLDSIVDELQARFDALGGDHAEPDADNAGGPSDMDADNAMKDEFDLATVREYVEKVGNGHGAEKKGQGEGQFSGTGKLSDKPNVNAKSIVAGKNDMGGTTANILSSKEEAPKYAGAGGGQLGGSSLFKGTPKEDNAGNINVPGGKAGSAFSTKEPGHGAEKKGEAEGKFSGAGGSSGSVDKASLFRGRR